MVYFLIGVFIFPDWWFFSSSAFAAEFNPFGIQGRSRSKNSYYSSLQVPNVRTGRICRGSGSDKTCWPVIRDGEGNRLKRFRSGSRLSVWSRARYEEIAYLLVYHRYDCGDNRCSEILLFDHQGNEQEINIRDRNRFIDLQVTHDRKLMGITEDEIIKMNLKGEKISTYKSSKDQNRYLKIRRGVIHNDIFGRQIAVAVVAKDNAESGEIWVFNGKKWKATRLNVVGITDKTIRYSLGDEYNVLSGYPLPDGGVAAVVYRYINVFNKGLYLLISDKSGVSYYPIFISAERNVGWNPELYVTENKYSINATDQSNNNRIQLDIPKNMIVKDQMPEPEPEKFPESKRDFSFFVGRGYMWRFWQVKSEAGNTEIDYHIQPSLLVSDRFSGKIGNIDLVLKYSEQLKREKIKEVGDKHGRAAEEATKQFVGTIGIDDFFGNSAGIRFDYHFQQTEGLANIIHEDKADTYQDFKVEYSKYGLYKTYRGGTFWGFEYADYQMPSAIAYKNHRGRVVYSNFDPELRLQNLMVVLGYDPQIYAHSFETNFSKWYLTGKGGMGIGKASVSTPVLREAAQETGFNSFTNDVYYFLMNLEIEIGWLLQLRSFDMYGIGLQLVSGYRGEFSMHAIDDSDKVDEDELGLSLERDDLWHGPFVNLNIVF